MSVDVACRGPVSRSEGLGKELCVKLHSSAFLLSGSFSDLLARPTWCSDQDRIKKRGECDSRPRWSTSVREEFRKAIIRQFVTRESIYKPYSPVDGSQASQEDNAKNSRTLYHLLSVEDW
jgi:hypothetical protein